MTPSDCLITTLYLRIGEPLVDGSVNAILTLVEVIEVVTATIYPGTEAGVIVRIDEYGPKLYEFSALILYW